MLHSFFWSSVGATVGGAITGNWYGAIWMIGGIACGLIVHALHAQQGD